MRIAHFADIHWHGSVRHKEYREVFSKIFSNLKKENIDYIVVCGDIFHTKTLGITPEIIHELSWWFNEMSKVAPSIITLGNHDGNLSNLQRMDTISPIVKALNNDRIHLLKDSGNFSIGDDNVNWCNFSPFDEESWNNILIYDDKINIALYHGCVQGSVIDSGRELLDYEASLDFFNKFDIALLGDIHKQQYLSQRNGKGWIAYPGSTIQQNYGESIDKGYLIWDIQDKNDYTSNFVKAENDYAFYNIKWDGNLQELDDYEFVKHPRIKIKLGSKISQQEILELESKIKQITAPEEIQYQKLYQDKDIAEKLEENKSLQNKDTVKNIVVDFFQDHNLNDAERDELEKTIDLVFAEAKIENVRTSNTTWHVKQIKFDNLFRYGEGNCIKFDDLNGIVGIFGPNKIGKSSIVGVLSWLLFNKVDRGALNNVDIINDGADFAKGEAIIEVGGKLYKIERQIVKKITKKGVAKAYASVNFSTIDEEENTIKDLNGEKGSETEKNIRDLVGTFEDASMTSFSFQNEHLQFIKSGSTKRDQLISKYLKLDIFEKMLNTSKEMSNELKVFAKKYRDRKWDDELESLKNNEINIQDEIELLSTEISDITKLISDRRKILNTSKESITSKDIDKEESRLRSIRCSIKSLQEEKDDLVLNRDKLVEKLDKLQKENEAIDIEKLRSIKDNIFKLKNKLTTLDRNHKDAKKEYDRRKKSVLRLVDVPCGDSFPTCKFIKDSKIDEKMIPVDEKKVQEALDELNKFQDKMKKVNLEKINKAIANFEKNVSDISEIKIKLANITSRLPSIEEKLSLLISQENEVLSSVQLLKEQVDLQKEEALNDCLNEISKYEIELKSKNRRRISLATDLGVTKEKLSRLNQEKREFDENLSKLKIYELIEFACSKKGIPLSIIRSQLPIINNEISNILGDSLDFTISLSKGDNSSATDIYIDYGHSKRVIETVCGMEGTIAAIVIRTALMNSMLVPKPSFLILDEGFGTLDDEGIILCTKFLPELKRFFKQIFLITHVQGIKDVINAQIPVKKVGKKSLVNI